MSRAASAGWLAACLALATATPAAAELRAGLGMAPLPISSDTPLAGYATLRGRRARTLLDPPGARALVLERPGLRVGIVALDVLIAAPALREPIAREQARLGLDALWLVATHTHSGPGGYLEHRLAARATGAPARDGAAAGIAAAAIAALEHALRDLAPARAGAATIRSDLAHNRRRRDGVDESALHLLRIDVDGRRPIALLVVGAHPTVVAAGVHAASADHPGALRSWLDARGWRTLVVPGALGDQGPGVSAGRLAQARLALDELGARVGRVAQQALEAIETDAGAALAHARHELTAPAPRTRFPCPLWWLSPWVRGATRVLWSPRVSVHALRTGGVRLLGVPAEPTAAVGAQLRALGDGSPIWVVSHTDAWLGYAVTREQYARGGYESCMSLLGPDGAAWLGEASAGALRLLDSAR